MLMTSLTACTAASYSLSSVMATIRSLNFDVKSSSLPFSSSFSYSGSSACKHLSRTSPTLSCSVQPMYLRYESSRKLDENFIIQMPISDMQMARISGSVSR
uniref:Putative secreted protein n=1 Tax=Anopheles triannulatus TaxID=58253 RepID=A0A2M4B640_9DIPT